MSLSFELIGEGINMFIQWQQIVGLAFCIISCIVFYKIVVWLIKKKSENEQVEIYKGEDQL